MATFLVDSKVRATTDAAERATDLVPSGGARRSDINGQHVFKILVTGPFAAGKTSLIRSVSQTPVVSTEVATSGVEASVKGSTTVAMDFGTFDLPDDGVRLLLFGTPGQARFGFMTDVLKGEVDVVTFVVDAEAESTHADAGAAMRSLLHDLRVPLVVAVNRCDDAERARMVARSLGALASEAVVPCQLVHEASGREVIVETLVTLLDVMERRTAVPAPMPTLAPPMAGPLAFAGAVAS